MNIVLILLFQAITISTTRGLTTDFAPVREKNWVLRYPTVVVRNIKTRFDCVTQCHETAGCVGGHWIPSNAICRLMVNRITKRVTYAKRQTLKGDFVFGTPCEAVRGYVKILNHYVAGENDAEYSTSSLNECIRKCNQFSWCRSADKHAGDVCYLSACDQFSQKLAEGDYTDKHAERLCWES